MDPVCHVVPAVPPVINGLGDYARQLYRHWPEPKPEWHTAALNVPEEAADAWPGSVPHRFGPKVNSLGAVLDETRAKAVVLHYVGYGYHAKGLPLALPRVLTKWKRRTGGSVITFFHELWATGPPTSLAYWSRPAAVWAVHQLMRLSDDWATSCHRYIRILGRMERRRDVGRRIPIGANIDLVAPPVLHPWPLQEGIPLRIVVFGTGLPRLRAMQAHQALLRHWTNQGYVEELRLIGLSPSQDQRNAIEALLASMPGLKVVEQYDLSEKEASAALSWGNVALIQNPWDIVHKSGTYAACVRHGLWCVIPGTVPVPADAPVIVAQADGVIAEGEVARATPNRRAEMEALAWESIVAEWVRLGR